MFLDNNVMYGPSVCVFHRPLTHTENKKSACTTQTQISSARVNKVQYYFCLVLVFLNTTNFNWFI